MMQLVIDPAQSGYRQQPISHLICNDRGEWLMVISPQESEPDQAILHLDARAGEAFLVRNQQDIISIIGLEEGTLSELCNAGELIVAEFDEETGDAVHIYDALISDLGKD